ncbi:hypothetical protein [Mesorhizobium sp. ES1-1]|uniref:hypothetical protein n=1 Tax=Mesorhizobium sp. ES1-1 TaxID=2876629 RepID=UPI001CCB20F2|nr:hypothetical protein [Mesorhizobium sp. ES1-1]MBZ9675650.1 hypothetical protein [Mesorhizobium sp. ES1-1]
MSDKKTYVLGEIEGGKIDKPFILKWAVKHDVKSADGHTSVFSDTAMTNGDTFSQVVPFGEGVGSTAPAGGGPGELGDTTI